MPTAHAVATNDLASPAKRATRTIHKLQEPDEILQEHLDRLQEHDEILQ
jgi:hypothetical protein